MVLQAGISAARAKDKDTARARFIEAVKLLPTNEQAWFWLASVAANNKERITALERVLQLNPNNERASKILAQARQMAEAEAQTPAGVSPAQAESVPTSASVGEENSAKGDLRSELGIKQAREAGSPVQKALGQFNALPARTKRLVIIGGVGGFLILCLLIFALGGGGGDDPNNEGQSLVQNTAGPSPTSVPTATPGPSPTPTLSPTPFITSTIPPTFTPTSSPTPTLEPTVIPAPPVGQILGKLVIGTGPATDYQPLRLYNLAQPGYTPISGSERGNFASVSGDGQRYIYIAFNPTSRRVDPIIADISGADRQFADEIWGRENVFENITMTAWAPNDQFLAFIARAKNGGKGTNLFLYFFNPLEGNPSFREIISEETVTYPAWSPDAARVVFVSDFTTAGGQGVDLQVYEIGTESVTSITRDGNGIAESMPDWSPDNATIVYSGHAQEGTGSDLYTIASDGSGEPELLLDFGPNDINPRWSPDGRYIAFSSNSAGDYDVYIYDTVEETVYHIPDDPVSTSLVHDWIR
jgi:hypothetical protein